MADRDWRLPGNRREAFQRFYSFHLKYRSHPGCVYFWLPAIADAYQLDEEERAWLVWLNGNTQNPVMSLLLLEAASRPRYWRKAVDFWNDHFKLMDWDTDRRHQKSKFGQATERWVEEYARRGAAAGWATAGMIGWDATWSYALGQPFMGRLSAWSMTEYARILLGPDAVPDAASFLMEDIKGSLSHRNGALLVAGHDSVYWKAEKYQAEPELVGHADRWAEDLLEEAQQRNPGHPDVGRLTLESALCTYKSWHKPNRRYPNVYADMGYARLMKAEQRFGQRFDLLWEARAKALPAHLRLEEQLHDPGMVPAKQNHYLETGEPIMMDREWPDMTNGFQAAVARGDYGLREDAARWLL